MTINEFKKRYTVDPNEIAKLFHLEKEITFGSKRNPFIDCPNCGGCNENLNEYNSTAWSTVKVCNKCDRIIIIWSGDSAEKTVLIYKPKETNPQFQVPENGEYLLPDGSILKLKPGDVFKVKR